MVSSGGIPGVYIYIYMYIVPLCDELDVLLFLAFLPISIWTLRTLRLAGAMAGVSFLCSLGITMTLLYAQQKQKRAKDGVSSSSLATASPRPPSVRTVRPGHGRGVQRPLTGAQLP